MHPQSDLGDDRGGVAAPSLDLGTKLILTAYPDAGEAVLYQQRSAPDVEDRVRSAGNLGSLGVQSQEEEEARQAKNQARATTRAKVESRRYIVANRLRYMWVLTRLGGEALHGPAGRRTMMRLGAGLAVALRTELGQDYAYWYSPELHPAGKVESRETCPDPEGCGCGGHGWHLNFFVRSPMAHDMVKRLWQDLDAGNGYEVRYKDWTKDSRLREMPFIERLRAGARYGTKYATKDWSETVLAGGAHRYEVAQGFKPRRVQVEVLDRREAEEGLSQAAGTTVQAKWCSADFDEWDGPLCWGYEWTPRSRGPS